MTELATVALPRPKRTLEEKRTLSQLRRCEEYQQVVTVAGQLLKLVADVQQHRGMTTAILAGNSGFEKSWAQTVVRIERRLLYIDTQDKPLQNITAQAMHQVRSEWQALKHYWRDDTPVQNFELHTHLVARLQQVISLLSRWLCAPHSAKRKTPDLNQHIVDFTFERLTAHIETLATLRGLTAYAQSAGMPGPELISRVEFLIKNTRSFHKECREFAASLTLPTLRQLPALMQTQINEPLQEAWLRAIPAALAARPGHINVEALFSKGSEVISHYARLEDECIHYIGRQLDDMLEKVIQPVR